MTQTIIPQVYRPVIPTAPRIPLVGSLPHIATKQFDYLTKAFQTHGDLFRVDLGVTDVILLNHPRHAQHILRDNVRNYRKGGDMWASVRTMFGNGLVVSEGDFWLRQRRMMQPHFHRRHLAGLYELMLSAIDEHLATWPVESDSFDFSAAMNQITMQVIVRTMFGTQLDDADFTRLSEAMTHALDYMLLGMIGTSLPSWVPLPWKRHYNELLATFDEIVFRVIEESRAIEGANNVLAMLLNTVDAETGEQMSDQQLRDEVATIFVAGYETTALALSWAADYLARDPILQARLSTEVAATVGQETPDLMSMRDLPLVKQTFQEALRIRPSAWFLPRLVLEDDEIDGRLIPAGSQVALMIKHIHHHPEQWESPEQFRPERFDEGRGGSRHPFAYVPFGAGQRQCIGRDFAYLEGQLILTRILQRYRLRPNGLPATPQLSSTLRPKQRVAVQLESC